MKESKNNILLIIAAIITGCLLIINLPDTAPAVGANSVDYPVYSADAQYVREAARIDSFFQYRHEQGLFNGTVLFAEKGAIVYKKALGYADFRKKDTLSPDSQFQLASVSKPFTAYAIMLLHQMKKLSYNDSIRHFFPRFPYDNITIHQLLTHRSGLPEYMYFSDLYWNEIYGDSTIANADVIGLIIDCEPKQYYKPGQRYNYINTNYIILASIIEEVTCKPYEQFMKEEIFEPLGMINTEVYNKKTQGANKHEVQGYIVRIKAGDTYLNGVVGDKNIYSTVEDLYKFDRALYEGTLVKNDEMEKAYLPGNEELYDTDNYGYGWRINKLVDDTKIVYHTGWWKGFRSYLIRDLKEEKFIAVLTNRSRSGVLSTEELLELFNVETVVSSQ